MAAKKEFSMAEACIVPVMMLSIFVLWIYLIATKKFPLDDVPNPKGGSWIFGHLKLLNRKAPFKTLHDWALEIGGFFKFKIMMRKIVVISRPSMVNQILVQNSIEYAGRPKTFRNDLYSEDGSGIAASDSRYRPNQDYLMRKKCVEEYMYRSPAKVQSELDTLSLKAVERLVDVIDEFKGKKFDARDVLLDASVDILMSTIRGKPLNEPETAVVKKILEDSVVELERGRTREILDAMPFLRYLGIGWSCCQKIKAIRDLKTSIVKDWFEGEEKSETGLIPHLEDMSYDDNFKFKLDGEKQKVNTIWDLLLQGAYPMTSTLAMLVNILAHRLDIQEKLHKETEEVEDSATPLESRAYLPYHQAVLLEAARYGCVVPITKPHRTTRNTILYKTAAAAEKAMDEKGDGNNQNPYNFNREDMDNEIKIPMDAEIWIDLWTLHHDERIWGADPFTFRPERFLDADEGKLIKANHPYRQSFMAFGGGARGCPGEHLVMSRMFLVLSRIVSEFRILPGSDKEEQASMDCRDMVQCGDFLMPPPFTVRMEKYA